MIGETRKPLARLFRAGDVYFAVLGQPIRASEWPAGLSEQHRVSSEVGLNNRKKIDRGSGILFDFALWKGSLSKPGAASFPPLGARSRGLRTSNARRWCVRKLGHPIDIHLGGSNLIFSPP